jgi:transmembrane sensor
MIPNDDQMRATIAEQAADWFVANDEGPLDEQESADLVAWLKASPIHVEEFLRLAGVARDLRAACAHPAHSADALLARARDEAKGPVESRWSRLLAPLTDVPARRWQTAAVAVAALVVSVALLLSWNLRPVAPMPAPEAVAALHYSTHHGELQTYRLADNSVLHLNTDTDVTVRYGRTERLVTLASGEAAFEVTHEPGRAFRVLAGPAQVVDLGTRFNVRRENHSAVVTVVDGRVAVAPSATLGTSGTNGSLTRPQQSVELGAGQQLNVGEGAWPATPVSVDAQRTTAWLHGQINFEGEPLERVVAEFNRYAQKPIEIESPALRDLEISGVFSIEDSEAFIAFLRSLDGVQVDVSDTRIRVSQK